MTAVKFCSVEGCSDTTIILTKPKSVAINQQEKEMHHHRVNHAHCLRFLLQDELSSGIFCLYKVD